MPLTWNGIWRIDAIFGLTWTARVVIVVPLPDNSFVTRFHVAVAQSVVVLDLCSGTEDEGHTVQANQDNSKSDRFSLWRGRASQNRRHGTLKQMGSSRAGVRGGSEHTDSSCLVSAVLAAKSALQKSGILSFCLALSRNFQQNNPFKKL